MGCLDVNDKDWMGQYKTKDRCTHAKGEDACISMLGDAADPLCSEVPEETCRLGQTTDSKKNKCKWAGPHLKWTQGIETREDCLDAGGTWELIKFNFDHVGEGMRSIYIIAAGDKWAGIMYDAIATTDVGYQPIPRETPGAFIFFFATMIIAMTSFQLIVAVTVDVFMQTRRQQDCSIWNTADQNTYLQTQRLVSQIRLKKKYTCPDTPFRKWCYQTINHKWFEGFIMFCITLNTVSMCMEYYGQSTGMSFVLNTLDVTFSTIFAIEAILKICAAGFSKYWMDDWNKFDFLVVVLSAIGQMGGSVVGGFNVIRVFRIGRVLRLVQRAERLRELFQTLWWSMPALWNVGSLLMIILFIYAIIGMSFFGNFGYMNEATGRVELREPLSQIVNFQTFPNAMLLLWRVMTGDEWGVLYKAYMDEEAGGNGWGATLYFMTFWMLGSLVLVNLYIAVVLDVYQDNLEGQRRARSSSPCRFSVICGRTQTQTPTGASPLQTSWSC